jgi:hypothetical protein
LNKIYTGFALQDEIRGHFINRLQRRHCHIDSGFRERLAGKIFNL